MGVPPEGWSLRRGIPAPQRRRGLEPEKKNRVLIFTSPDLLPSGRRTDPGSAGEVTAVADVRCQWDGKAGLYRLTWSDGTGYYTSSSPDLTSFTGMEKTGFPEPRALVKLSDGVDGCLISLTQEEYEKVLRRYSPVVQTGCLPVYCNGSRGKRSLPEQVTLTYSDGSLKPMPVKWSPSQNPARRVLVAGAVSGRLGLSIFGGAGGPDGDPVPGALLLYGHG